ncbi:MAG TPA: aminomethyl-transferring glycine dehydrogenase subunit GcvPB, partial [Geothrix sp.]|nr:aminomethyl-transferring glycine dehydrogenase subunit GcvPB [Geothrix sp.]
ICGMDSITLQPAAGAHGALTGILMARAYLQSKGNPRKKILIPDSAHGTNPATAAICGYGVENLKSNAAGMVDVPSLVAQMNDDVAALMVTNPNTLGVFEQEIHKVAEIMHQKGGLLYMDGANMNALVGKARPGDFGVDVMHLNLHKTMSTPHGGGGPGAGPVCCVESLIPFLPVPVVIRDTEKVGEGEVPKHSYRFEWDRPQSIGKVHTFFGNFGILVRALTYCLSHGSDGLREATMRAIVNANYVRARLKGAYALHIDSPSLHEVVFSDTNQAKHGVHTLDIAKRIIDHGYHPPTIYFPLIVPGALMIEPTESEGKDELDAFCDMMLAIAKEAEENPDALHQAPTLAPLRRMDETTAARKPVLRWTKA